MIVALFAITFFFTAFGKVFGLDGNFATGLSIKNLLFALSGAAILFSIATRRIPAYLPLSVFAPLWIGFTLAGLWILVISFFSVYSGYSYVNAIISLKNKLLDPLIMLTIGYFAAQTPRSATRLFRLFTFMIVSGCVLTIVDVFNIPDLGLITNRGGDGRVEGFIGSAAEFSTVVAATLPILMIGIKWHRGYSKLLLYFSIIMLLSCLLLAATRAPIVGLFVAWLIHSMFVERRFSTSPLRAVSIIVPALAVVSFALYFTPYSEIISDRFTTGLSTGNVDVLSSGRSSIWEGVYTQMVNQPSSFLIGMGWDVYFQSVGHRFATHSIFIDRFFSLGCLGIFVYLFAYWSALRLLFASSTRNSDFSDSIRVSAGLSLVVLLTSALFADLEIAESFIYAFVGIGLRCSIFSESKFQPPANAGTLQRYAEVRQGFASQ